MTITSLLLFSVLQAAEPDIQYVPAGTTVTPAYAAYLLPERHYNACLSNALNLEVSKKALNECHALSQVSLDQARETITLLNDALTVANGQFNKDEQLVESQALEIDKLKVDNLKLRGQRNVAWAVTSGIVFTGVAAVVIAVKSWD
jgi:hypothetical protein